LEGLDELREFAIEDSGNGKLPGRPAKENPLVEPLRKFVLKQRKNFDYRQLKSGLGNPKRRDQIRGAIKTLEDQGVLEVVESPMGRKRGNFRPILMEGTD
jgi:hypothetical protein